MRFKAAQIIIAAVFAITAVFFGSVLIIHRNTLVTGGLEYQHTYAKVMDSHTDKHIGMSVPVPENLGVKLHNRFNTLALVFLAFGIAAAAAGLGLIAKSYRKVAEQNRCLETLNEITRSHTEKILEAHQMTKRMMDAEPVCSALWNRQGRIFDRMTGDTLRLKTELEAALNEAKEANRAKIGFLENKSREMRAPLNTIIGLSELILNAGSPSQQAALKPHIQPLAVWNEIENKLGKINRSGAALLGILNDILDLSKIESGKFKLHHVKYNISDLINDIVSLNIVRIGKKPIQFILTINENLPEQLLGDDLRVRQIFNNLLSNAFTYTDCGSVELKITYERNGDSIWLVCEIKDTGMGIRSEDIKNIFEDYSRINTQVNNKTESSGLSLCITKHLAGMMDGTVIVESEYGKGSIFSVRLRQQLVSDIPIGKEKAENIMRACFADNKRIQSANLNGKDLSNSGVPADCAPGGRPCETTPGGITITGVDVAEALRRFNNNEEEYINILKSYSFNIRPLLSKIEKQLSNGTLGVYAISVHGIKGASFGIGAADAGFYAQKLEQLAKAGKMKQTAEENSAFIEIMKNLLDSIDSAIDQYAAINKKPFRLEPDPALLAELRDACNDHDVSIIDRIMEQLQSFEYKNSAELVAWLHEQVYNMNFSMISTGSWPVFK